MDCKKCKEQTALLRECREVVLMAADLRHGNVVEDVLKLHPKAAALIPKLEKYKEVE